MILCPLDKFLSDPASVLVWDYKKHFFSVCTYTCVIQPCLYIILCISAISSIPHSLRRFGSSVENISKISCILIPLVHILQLFEIVISSNSSLEQNFCESLKGAIGLVSTVLFIFGGSGIGLIRPETIGQKLYSVTFLTILVLNTTHIAIFWEELPNFEQYFYVSFLIVTCLCFLISAVCVFYIMMQESHRVVCRNSYKTLLDYLISFLFLKGATFLYLGTDKFSRSSLLQAPYYLSKSVIEKNTEKLINYFDKHKLLLIKVLRMFGTQLFYVGILYLIHIGNSFARAVILERLIKAISTNQDYVTIAVHSSILVSSCLICFLSDVYYNYHTDIMALSIEVTLQKSIFQYVIDSTIQSNPDEKVGKVCSIMSTDIKKLSSIIRCLHPLIWCPIQIIIGFYLLYSHLGATFFVGVGFAVLLIPFNHAISTRIQKVALLILQWKDKRMKIVSELLENFVGIKLYGWEKVFYERITETRAMELKYMKQRKYLDALCVVSWCSLTTIVSFSSFATYYLLGNDLTAPKVFASIAVFNILIFPLNALSWYINGIIESVVSEKRICEFILSLKIENISDKRIQNETQYLMLENCSFSWSNNIDTPILQNIFISVKKGELLGIAGPNASGKSSLLMAFANKLHLMNGNVYVQSDQLKFSFITQDPWIYEGTLKDNILMGSDFNPKKYDKVIKACCLDIDVKAHTNEDELFLSHNGSNLSGGQKTRVALARCIYKDADVYLLDDFLKDVDSIVAKKIMKNAINGYLEGKTRIVCFTDISFTKYFTRVIVLDRGEITKIIKKNDEFIEISTSHVLSTEKNVPTSEADGTQNPVVVEEDYQQNEGYVKATVYWKYGQNIGVLLLLFIGLSIVLCQASLQGNNSWLSHLVSNWLNYNYISRRNSIIVYCELVGFVLGFATLRAFLFAYGTLVASKHIHDTFLRKTISRSPACIDESSVGDTVNRFSTDVYGVDYHIPFLMNIFLASLLSFSGTILIILFSAPYCLIVAVPLFSLCILVQTKYRRFASFLKRMALNDLTPIYNALMECITGSLVIDIMDSRKWFLSRFQDYVYDYISSQYTLFYMEQWLSITINFLGLLIIIGFIITINLMIYYNVGKQFMVNLSITYIVSLANSMSSLFSSFINIDQVMIHSERIFQYDSDETFVTENKKSDDKYEYTEYDQTAVLEYKNVMIKYFNGFCPYPEGLRISFKKGLTIGICGTTGAGKSSIFKALFGIAPVVEGDILLKGIGFRNYTRKQLNKICYILPQDPVIFDNSIRFNLDLAQEYADDQLWNVLKETGIGDLLLASNANLNCEIGPGGLSLTRGQSQLLCLARALLHKPELLFLDEATSSTDKTTDEKMWNIIHKHFTNSTVIIIAHRLSNIVTADKVIVIEKGTVLEYDNPEVLLRDPTSKFYKMLSLQRESVP